MNVTVIYDIYQVSNKMVPTLSAPKSPILRLPISHPRATAQQPGDLYSQLTTQNSLLHHSQLTTHGSRLFHIFMVSPDFNHCMDP